MKVKISREARILMGLMFAAAAVLVWINFFTQQRQGFGLFGNQNTVSSSPSVEYVVPDASTTPVNSATSETGVTDTLTSDATVIDPTTINAASADVTAIDPTTIAADPTPVADASNPIDASVVATDTTGVEAVATEVPSDVIEATADAATINPEATNVDATANVEAAPEVTVTQEVSSDVATEAAPVALPVVSAPTAARDIELAELPFLVTELPVDAEITGGTEETALEVARPGEQRASINPFAPIVLKPVEAEVAPLPEGQGIVEVPIPDAPTNLTTVEAPAGVETQTLSEVAIQGDGAVLEPGAPIETTVLETPLPQALTPAPEVASLPRPLPGGTLPVAPEILRTMNTTADVNTASTDGQPVADLQPEVAQVEVAIRLPDQAPIATSEVEESTPAIIAPEETDLDLQPVTGLASDIEATPNGGPIAAGLSNLSRYLRDNDVRFTGSVIGPVGVGIFRSNLSQAPYVITLGQTIPNTDIVLTSLQGKQAQFTQGQEVQSLTLDLRR